MVELVARYFMEHNRLELPGVGLLTVTQAPAKPDGGRQLVHPPRMLFNWLPQTRENEGMQALAGYVSRQTQLTEEESFEAITGFCETLKTKLAETGEFTIGGVGKLVRLSEETTGFVPDAVYDVYLPVLQAPVVTGKGEPHLLLVGDRVTDSAEMEQFLNGEPESETQGRWWIAPLVLALAGLALIVGKHAGWL